MLYFFMVLFCMESFYSMAWLIVCFLKSTNSGTHNSQSICFNCLKFWISEFNIIAIRVCDYETTPLRVIAIYGNNLVTLGTISILSPHGIP